MITVITKKEDVVTNIAFSENEVIQLQDLLTNHLHSFVRRKALALLLKSQGIAHHIIAKIIIIIKSIVSKYESIYINYNHIFFIFFDIFFIIFLCIINIYK
jgi:hypothetical protein